MPEKLSLFKIGLPQPSGIGPSSENGILPDVLSRRIIALLTGSFIKHQP